MKETPIGFVIAYIPRGPANPMLTVLRTGHEQSMKIYTDLIAARGVFTRLALDSTRYGIYAVTSSGLTVVQPPRKKKNITIAEVEKAITDARTRYGEEVADYIEKILL